MKLLYSLIIALVLVNCGEEDRKKDNSHRDLPLVTTPKRFAHIDEEKNLKIATDDNEKYRDSMEKGLAESKAWGESLKSEFIPNLPESFLVL